MADLRILEGVKIVDADTPANSVQVDASGNLVAILAANTGVDIGDVDVISVVPGTAATNLGKAVDAVAGAADVGIAPLAVRDDALGGLTEAAGDYAQLRVDANGALWTHDDALDAVIAGSELQVDVVAALPTGANTIGSIASITTSVTPGTGAANLGKAENAASAAGDTLVAIAAVQDATLSALGSIDGDYTQLRVNSQGALHVTGGGGGTEYTVNDVVPADPTGATFVMERDDVLATLAEAEADWTNPRATAEGALWVQDFNSDAILADTNTLAGAVAGSEMQVDIVAVTPDLMLGTDFSTVFGTVDLTESDDDSLAFAQDGARMLSLLYGSDGTAWERVRTDGAGALHVAIQSGGGEALPTNPVRTTGSSTDTAAAASFSLDGPSSDGTTTTVRGFDAAASVPIKAELQTVANGAGTTILTVFAQAGENVHWRAPHRDFFDTTHPSNAGFDGFRLVLTNLDNENAANLYATLYTED